MDEKKLLFSNLIMMMNGISITLCVPLANVNS